MLLVFFKTVVLRNIVEQKSIHITSTAFSNKQDGAGWIK